MSQPAPTVKNFMGRGVKFVRLNTPVTVAIGLMVEHNIGSVAVIGDAGPAGIFTERDLLTHLLQQSQRTETPIISEVTKARPATIRQDETLHDAAVKMLSERSRLLVLENHELIGIVTATDLVREIQRLDRPFGLKNVISKKVMRVSPETSVGIAVQMMDEKKIGSVLVGVGRSPTGIFTERDLLRKVISKNLKLSTRVGEVASSPLISSLVGINGPQAARIMVENGIKRLPLFEGEKLFGMVTARDVVEAFANAP